MRSATMWLGIAGGMLMTVLMAKARRGARAGPRDPLQGRRQGPCMRPRKALQHGTSACRRCPREPPQRPLPASPSLPGLQNGKGAIMVGILFVTFISWWVATGGLVVALAVG